MHLTLQFEEPGSAACARVPRFSLAKPRPELIPASVITTTPASSRPLNNDRRCATIDPYPNFDLANGIPVVCLSQVPDRSIPFRQAKLFGLRTDRKLWKEVCSLILSDLDW